MKNIPKFCIDHPVTTIVFNLLFIVIGIIGFARLQVRELPQFQSGTVKINTTYSGASPEVVENQVTSVIENYISGVEGVKYISSNSSTASSSIKIVFKEGYDINQGLNDLRDKLAVARRRLPVAIDAPIISKVGGDQQSFFINIIDPNRSVTELYDYVKHNIVQDFENIEGVSSVGVGGSDPYSMRIWLNPGKMSALNVTVGDIIGSLRAQNSFYPGGAITAPAQEFSVNVDSILSRAGQFQNIIVKKQDNYFVKMSDVAKVNVGQGDIDSMARINGKDSVIMGISLQSLANPVSVEQVLKNKIKFLNKVVPQGMNIKLVYSEATFIRDSISEVYKTIFEAIILVSLVVFLFLGSIRAAFIPVITIPFCLIASFAILYYLGFSINNMTLLALVLSIGLVVDDAIVILENVHRHIEEDMIPKTAALLGSQEISTAIVIMTLTLASVYAPIGFAGGMAGKIFGEFAFTLAGAVLISGFVALTLSPMLCSKILQAHNSEKPYEQKLEQIAHKAESKYQNILSKVLNNKKMYFILISLFIIIGIFSYIRMKSELAPSEDQGYFLTFIDTPPNTNFDYANEKFKKLENILLNKKYFPDNEDVISIVPNIIFTVLKGYDSRTKPTQYYINESNKQVSAIPGIISYSFIPTVFSMGGGKDISFIVKYNGSYDSLAKILANFKKKLEKNPGLTKVTTSLKMDQSQIDINLHREEIADLGINIQNIGNSLQVLLGGMHVTDFKYGANLYEVYLQAPRSLRDAQSKIENYYVKSSHDDMIPLSSLVSIKNKTAAASLEHRDKMRSGKIKANLAPGYKLGDAINYIEKLAKKDLSNKAQYTWSGQVQYYLESGHTMLFLIALALIFIYLILSSQFESFIDPIIIMFTVPFSIAGAVIVLYLAGGTNNLYTQIGYVTLIGLITKHGILITEFANRKLEQGLSVLDAVTGAAVVRLRPILMTTAAMVLGAMPLVLASGPGSHARNQLGLVIVGGMTLGTIFSLLVVPMVYVVIKNLFVRKNNIEI